MLVLNSRSTWLKAEISLILTEHTGKPMSLTVLFDSGSTKSLYSL